MDEIEKYKYRDELADKLKDIRNSDTDKPEIAKAKAQGYLESTKERDEKYTKARKDHLDSIESARKNNEEIEFDFDTWGKDFPNKISKQRALIILDGIIDDAEKNLNQLESEFEKIKEYNKKLDEFLPKILKGEIPIIYEEDDIVRAGGSTLVDNKWDTYQREYTHPIIDHYEYELNLKTGDVKLIKITLHKEPPQEINPQPEDAFSFPVFVDYKRKTRTDDYGRGDISRRMTPFAHRDIKVDEKGLGRLDEEKLKDIKSRIKKYKNASATSRVESAEREIAYGSGGKSYVSSLKRLREKIEKGDKKIKIADPWNMINAFKKFDPERTEKENL